MGYYGAQDLDVMLSDFGVPVVVSGVSGRGILNIQDVPMLSSDGATLSGQQIELTLKTGAFADLKHGTAITVDGVNYTVVTARHAPMDGALTVAYLRRA